MEIKVSVIIPVYNEEKYIKECINSVLNQTLEEIEIICINDGSTDSSGNILQEFSKKDHRIRIISQDNRGLSVSRNVGIDCAKGEYVLFLDSDDFLVEIEALECLYNKAKSEVIDELFYGTKVLFESDEIREENERFAKYYVRNKRYPMVLSGKEMFVLFSKNGDFKPNVCMQMFRTKFLLENQLKFEEGLIHEDEVFTVKCMTFAERVGYIENKYFGRRIRKNSIMTTLKKQNSILGYCKGAGYLSVFAHESNAFEEREFYSFLKKRTRILLELAAKLYWQVSVEEQEKIMCELSGEQRVFFELELERWQQIDTLKTQIDTLKKQLSEEQHAKEDTIREKQNADEKLEKKEKELEKIKNSNSYKIGRSITYIPRKSKQLIKKN